MHKSSVTHAFWQSASEYAYAWRRLAVDTMSLCAVQHTRPTIDNVVYSSIAGFNVPLYTFRRRFYRSDDPTNSVIALKDDSLPGQGPIPQAHHSKRQRKRCKLIKIFHSTKYTEDTEALGRQPSQARSKPDPVDRVWTAHYIGVHMSIDIWQMLRTAHWTIPDRFFISTIFITLLHSLWSSTSCCYPLSWSRSHNDQQLPTTCAH